MSAERIFKAGREAFPDVAATPEAMLPLIRRRLETEDAPESLAADEIYLACACALAVPAAFAAFERRYFSIIPAALSRLSLGRDAIVEVEQLLRIRLFVAEDMPRVVAYAGHGQLGGLVRVAALRVGLNLIRDRGRADPASDELDGLPVADDDPALAQLKSQHRTAFKAAFEEATASLPARDRSVLYLALVKGVGIDAIGVIYGVHRATAARWVASARADLTRRVHRVLAAKLGVAQSELAELLPLVESQLELSLDRLLASAA